MAVINMLPQGGGVNAKGFIVTPWFVKGQVYNTDVFGLLQFYTQQNGRVNSDTYATDGYIHANYTSAGYSSVMISTGNYLPRTYDFALIRLKHIRIASANYALGFGTSTTYQDTTRRQYRWSNTDANYDYWLTIPLDVVNPLNVNEYLSIGGSSEYYIYEIYFMKAKV